MARSPGSVSSKIPVLEARDLMAPAWCRSHPRSFRGARTVCPPDEAPHQAPRRAPYECAQARGVEGWPRQSAKARRSIRSWGPYAPLGAGVRTWTPSTDGDSLGRRREQEGKGRRSPATARMEGGRGGRSWGTSRGAFPSRARMPYCGIVAW
eukprot:scaffold1388_cov390-Prasinococcus_capsulatus_cf.AAC.23